MANTIDRREYGLRLQRAKEFYKDNQLSSAPDQQYKFELGKAVEDNPQHFQQIDKLGSRNVDAIDQEVGQNLIAKGICNKETYAQVLDKHSPNAGLQNRQQIRDAYTKGRAASADRVVNTPNFKEARTKHKEQDGRENSTIEDRSQRSSKRLSQQQNQLSPSQNYQRQVERDR